MDRQCLGSARAERVWHRLYATCSELCKTRNEDRAVLHDGAVVGRLCDVLNLHRYRLIRRAYHQSGTSKMYKSRVKGLKLRMRPTGQKRVRTRQRVNENIMKAQCRSDGASKDNTAICQNELLKYKV